MRHFLAVRVNQLNHLFHCYTKLGINLCLAAAVNAAQHEFGATANEALRERSNITHAIREQKSLRFWMMTLNKQRADARRCVYDRRHLCKDCVQVFAALLKQDGD